MATYTVFDVCFGADESLHHGIFVQTSKDGHGFLLDVRGAVNADGRMVFSSRAEQRTAFNAAILKGSISQRAASALQSVCESVVAPDSQYVARSESGLAAPNCRCGEWIQKAWGAIRVSGLMKG